MIYRDLNAYDLKHDLINHDRDYFSLEALEIYINLCNECDYNIEWDAIGFCCEWTEMTASEVIENYDINFDYYGNIIDFLQDYTIAYETDKGYFFMQF